MPAWSYSRSYSRRPTDPSCQLAPKIPAKEGVQSLAEDWERLISRIAALGDERLLEPMGLGPGWAGESYLKLALHALDEVAHHGGEIGLLRDLYLREGV